MKKPMLSQKDCNPEDPEEHALWALRNLPSFAGSGVITHVGFLRLWSKHLWEAGFRHRDYLESLADENGNIHVSKLPEQEIRFQEPFRGPHHQYNNAARWVRAGEPDPEPIVIPNVKEMTIQEKYAMAYQLKAEGVIIPEPVQPSKAAVHHDEGVPE